MHRCCLAKIWENQRQNNTTQNAKDSSPGTFQNSIQTVSLSLDLWLGLSDWGSKMHTFFIEFFVSSKTIITHNWKFYQLLFGMHLVISVRTQCKRTHFSFDKSNRICLVERKMRWSRSLEKRYIFSEFNLSFSVRERSATHTHIENMRASMCSFS